MYAIIDPQKIAVYVNGGERTFRQIQSELGCDYLINGGLYELRTCKPACWLRVDGETLHGEYWSDWGYGWDTDRLTLDSSVNRGNYRNFISCVCIVRNGSPVAPLHYPAALGGRRARSAVGTNADGRVVVCCVPESKGMTPEQLRAEMLRLGCVDALMLDGGASSQCIMPGGAVRSARRVHNCIAIWTRAPDGQPIGACPYPEPAKNVRWGSVGAGAKWVQWHLDRSGCPCAVDGLFYGGSVAALKKYQAAHGLVADGVCGTLTREAMKK